MENTNWKEKLELFKIPIALSLVGLVLIVGGILASGLNKQKPKVFPKESVVESQKMVSVDISGAVVTPGVYRLTEGSRIEDAVSAAGGFANTVNKEYISKYLNMAQKLSDGSKIYVPAEGEQAVNSQNSAVVGTSAPAKINVNTALQAELEALPGIGPVTALKIISARPYQTAEELLSKKAIGKSVFDKIKDQLVVY